MGFSIRYSKSQLIFVIKKNGLQDKKQKFLLD